MPLRLNPRARAAQAVSRVMAGKNLDEALAGGEGEALSGPDRALLKAMTYGVVREHRLLSDLLARLVEHPLKNEPAVNALLLVGLHQLRSMRIAAHAAVGETVEATAQLDKPRLRGLVNAVLRRYQREREALEALLPRQPEIHLSYPDWLAARILKDWPGRGAEVLAAGNEQAPLTLRVNRRLILRETYQLKLAASGIAAQTLDAAPDALVLESARGVEDIPGFSEGYASVQDASAQLAADLLDLQPGQRVLDACAAPGGKTAHLLERGDDLYVMALDHDEQRLLRVQDTLRRLQLQARIVTGSAAEPMQWWDGNPFDRILLDAPCSGTGVIRRHPDIKWLRRETDIAKLAATQKQMLHALWPLLERGGTLLYATCSILKAECEDVVKHFLITHPDAKHVPIEAGWGEACSVGRRIAPGGAWDGFYYAKLKRA